MIRIEIDTDTDTERVFAKAIEEMLGLLPQQVVVTTAPRPASVIRVASNDGPYTLFFTVPDGQDPEVTKKIVNDAVGDMYKDEPDDPLNDLLTVLFGKGIDGASVYDIDNVF